MLRGAVGAALLVGAAAAGGTARSAHLSGWAWVPAPCALARRPPRAARLRGGGAGAGVAENAGDGGPEASVEEGPQQGQEQRSTDAFEDMNDATRCKFAEGA